MPVTMSLILLVFFVASIAITLFALCFHWRKANTDDKRLNLLGSMVALLSILVAVAAYFGNRRFEERAQWEQEKISFRVLGFETIRVRALCLRMTREVESGQLSERNVSAHTLYSPEFSQGVMRSRPGDFTLQLRLLGVLNKARRVDAISAALRNPTLRRLGGPSTVSRLYQENLRRVSRNCKEIVAELDAMRPAMNAYSRKQGLGYSIGPREPDDDFPEIRL